jgi:hypothetical protein
MVAMPMESTVPHNTVSTFPFTRRYILTRACRWLKLSSPTLPTSITTLLRLRLFGTRAVTSPLRTVPLYVAQENGTSTTAYARRTYRETHLPFNRAHYFASGPQHRPKQRVMPPKAMPPWAMKRDISSVEDDSEESSNDLHKTVRLAVPMHESVNRQFCTYMPTR